MTRPNDMGDAFGPSASLQSSISAAPPIAKPLSDAEALRVATEAIGLLTSAGPVAGLIGLVRAVEAAHGIGRKE